MDIQSKQPISDDQELAKVLAGITAGADGDQSASDVTEDLAQESTSEASDNATQVVEEMQIPAPEVPTPPQSTPSTPAPEPAAPVVDSSLEAIKNDALLELRPLVDKLNVSPEEKFDTYLLLLRSTDDSTLVAPAFEAARAITDEAEKAQALLDIVKEIDYLSNPQKQV